MLGQRYGHRPEARELCNPDGLAISLINRASLLTQSLGRPREGSACWRGVSDGHRSRPHFAGSTDQADSGLRARKGFKRNLIVGLADSAAAGDVCCCATLGARLSTGAL